MSKAAKKPLRSGRATNGNRVMAPGHHDVPRIEIFDCEQNTPEWLAARNGIITASNFSKVMAGGEGKTRTRYMRDLAGEILTGITAETFESSAMKRGREMEHGIREAYAASTFEKIQRVGFVKNRGLMKYAEAGCSPDALVGDKGGLEIKSMIPALLIELLERGSSMPPEHRAQVQGNMWVCEREWWDFRVGYTGMPAYEVRVYRDETYIKQISDAVEIFSYELKQLVEKLRKMGC